MTFKTTVSKIPKSSLVIDKEKYFFHNTSVLKDKFSINETSGTGNDLEEVKWQHPGGKLRRLGPDSCTENELLAIVLGAGIKNKSAQAIADEIIDNFHSLYGLMGLSLKELMQIDGLKEVKATRIAAVFEITRRILNYLEKE